MSEVQTNSLRAIVAQTKDIVTMLAENDGELTPEIEAALISLEDRTPSKIDGYAMVMDRLEMEAAFWQAKANWYAKVAKSCDNVREKLKENLKFAMETLGATELKGNDIRFKLSATKGKLVINEEVLDPGYLKSETRTFPDKKRIEDDLKLGVPIEGAMILESFSLRKYANSKGDS